MFETKGRTSKFRK